MADTHTAECSKCGGPLLGEGVEGPDGTVHAVCSVTERGDPDMNPEAKEHRRRAASYAVKRYGSVEEAPDWITRPLDGFGEQQ